MPCYEPPPEWEGDARRSAEDAAKLLCVQVGSAIRRGEQVSIPLMRWYVGHRYVDLRMIADPRMGLRDTSALIRAEIQRVEQMIEAALDATIEQGGSDERR